MPRKNPRQMCKLCGGHVSEVGYVSLRGKCKPCRLRRQIEANDQIAAHEGPWFEYWRHRMAASVGASIPERQGVQSESR